DLRGQVEEVRFGGDSYVRRAEGAPVVLLVPAANGGPRHPVRTSRQAPCGRIGAIRDGDAFAAELVIHADDQPLNRPFSRSRRTTGAVEPRNLLAAKTAGLVLPAA